jgi:glycosyltransferase involved in cell wall biosynthesis
LHIAFVTTESPYGDAGACGIAAYLRAMIPEIVTAGHRVSVFANAEQEKEFFAEDGRVAVQHFRLPSLHWYVNKLPAVRLYAPLPLRQLEWSRAFYRRVARVAAREKIDVIESAETGSLFLDRIAPLVIRLHGSELTFRKHSGIPLDSSVKWSDQIESYACRRAAAITSPSQSQAEEIIRRRRWQAARVRVIPNPVSTPLLRAALEFRRNGNTERVVLYTGRLAPVKGIEVLLAAARLVHERDPSVQFVLAGPWQMPQPPEGYGLKLNQQSADGVHWVGPQDHKDLIQWYKRSAVFVMPSYYETFGISVLEALTFGLPVVAAESGGLSELLRTNSLVSLVPKGDPMQLADAIMRRISSTNSAGEKDRLALQKFEAAHVANEMIKVYESVQVGRAR